MNKILSLIDVSLIVGTLGLPLVKSTPIITMSSNIMTEQNISFYDYQSNERESKNFILDNSDLILETGLVPNTTIQDIAIFTVPMALGWDKKYIHQSPHNYNPPTDIGNDFVIQWGNDERYFRSAFRESIVYDTGIANAKIDNIDDAIKYSGLLLQNYHFRDGDANLYVELYTGSAYYFENYQYHYQFIVRTDMMSNSTPWSAKVLHNIGNSFVISDTPQK